MTTNNIIQSDQIDYEVTDNDFKILFAGSKEYKGIISELNIDFESEFIDLEGSILSVSTNFSHKNLRPAIQYAELNDFDMVIGVDQSFQKLCVAVKNQNNIFQLLSPHQLAAVVVYARLKDSKKEELLIAKSIHISEMIEKMVNKEDFTCLDFYNESGTIADKVEEISLNNGKIGVLGFSENQEILDTQIGFNGIIENIISVAGTLKEKDKTLIDLVIKLYREFGFYKEKTLVVDYKNPSQKDHVLHVMNEIRKKPTVILDSLEITHLVDYKKGKSINLQTKKQLPLNFPTVNILQSKFADGTSITFVPEEDKVTYFISMKGINYNKLDFEEDNKKLDERIIKIVQLINRL